MGGGKATLPSSADQVVVCYSEPTGQILTAIFHELSTHPEHIGKIRQELTGVSITDFKALTALPHLNAVIQEAMRLHPNLLTGGSRKTMGGGVVIGDVHIPPDITVVTPHYTIARRMLPPIHGKKKKKRREKETCYC